MLQFDVQASDIAADVVIVDLACDSTPAARPPTAIVIGVDRAATTPMVNAADFDLLLTAGPQPTRDWIAVDAAEIDAMLEHLCAQVRGFGLPAAVLAQVLRIGSGLPVADALLLESFAYSALLGGKPFGTGCSSVGRGRCLRPVPECAAHERADLLTITLAHPSRRNAIDACMRDELVEHLAFACDDPTPTGRALARRWRRLQRRR